MRASIIFTCIILALSCVNAQYLIKKEYSGSSTCSSNLFSAAGVIRTNECILLGDEDYNIVNIYGNIAVMKSECDSTCTYCNSDDGSYTLDACNQDTDENGDPISFTVSLSEGVPSSIQSLPAMVMYGNEGCSGNWGAILFENAKCPFVSSLVGKCTFGGNGTSFYPYCSLPSSYIPSLPSSSASSSASSSSPSSSSSSGSSSNTNGASTGSNSGTNFNINGLFVVNSMYDNNKCSGSPANATAQAPGTCVNMMGVLSTKYDYVKNVLTEYFCSDVACADCFSFPVSLDTCKLIPDHNSDDENRAYFHKLKRELNGYSASAATYSSYSVVKGFPKNLADGKLITVSYEQTGCVGSATGVMMFQNAGACIEMCLPFVDQKSFCSYSSFASSIPAYVSSSSSDSSSSSGSSGKSNTTITISISAIVVLVVGGIVTSIVVYIIKKRSHGKSHHHGGSDYHPLMQGGDDHHHHEQH